VAGSFSAPKNAFRIWSAATAAETTANTYGDDRKTVVVIEKGDCITSRTNESKVNE
jgi:hypothetical protein